MSTASEAVAHAQPGNGDAEQEHVTPLGTYFKVYGALLVLTYITVQVSLWDLGDPAIYVAMAVALVKATLVALYFMHLRHDTGFNRFVFVASLLFLVIFFGLTMVDLGTRGEVIEAQDTFALQQEKAAAKQPVTPPPASPAVTAPAAAATPADRPPATAPGSSPPPRAPAP
jgi:cytochrome c oxidase subunit 4